MNGSRWDGPPRIEFWATLKEPGIDWSPLGFSRPSRNMAARTPCNASGEDENGGGDPQQILRSCAESLFTAVAQLQGGETPVARSSSPSTSSTAIKEHRRLFGYQTPSSSRCARRSATQRGQGPSKKVMVTASCGKCNVFPVKNTWTKLFVCLSRTNDQEVPTTSGKISLNTERAYKRSAVCTLLAKTRHLRWSKQLENNGYAFTSETTKIRS